MKEKGASHKDHLHRLKRVEGQVRGLIKMVEEEKYCINILTQVKAARSALKAFELKILEGHLRNCVNNSIQSKNAAESEEMIQEILGILKKSTRG